MAAIFGFAVSNATEVTFDFTKNAYGLPNDQSTYVTTPTTITADGVSILLGQSGTGNAWRMWTDGLREYYKGNPYFTVSANGEPIKAVSWTTTATSASFVLDGTSEPMTSWTGNETSVTFVSTSTDNKAVKTITVIFGEDAEVEEPEESVTPEVREYNVTDAIKAITDGYEGEAIITGIVTRTTYFNDKFGSITYFISDDGTTTDELQVYGGLGLNGEKFAAQTDVVAGAKVVVKGSVKMYQGTPEVDMNSVLLSYEAPEGEEVEEPVVPPTEEPEYEYVTFDFANPTLYGYDIEDGQTEIDLTGVTLTSEMFSILSEATETASTKPRFFYGTSNGVSSWSYRFYKDNTITIFANTANVAIMNIVFDATNLNNTSIVFSDNGSFDKNNKWSATSEDGVSSMTITKTATGSNPVIKMITVYYQEKDTTGIDTVNSDNEISVYYNLQGIRVNETAPGNMYIKRTGNNVSKVIVR